MKNKDSIWKKDSWRGLPIRQQPNYKDQTHLKKVEEKISKLPPLVFAGEVRNLKSKLSQIQKEAPARQTHQK